jgi:hypothetical protein
LFKDDVTLEDEGCSLSDAPLQVPTSTSTSNLTTSNQNEGQFVAINGHLEGQLDDQRAPAPNLPPPSVESASRDVPSESGLLDHLWIANIAECLDRNE